MEKIMFALDVEDGWPPVSSEGAWCERVDNLYKFRNVPFFISGLAFNDIFSAERDPVNDHIFEFEVVEKSGHSVVWLMNNADIDISEFKEGILKLGCSFESFPRFSLGAIDVPPNVDLNPFDRLIDEYEERGLAFAFPVWRADENI
jgi:hypothetical protein